MGVLGTVAPETTPTLAFGATHGRFAVLELAPDAAGRFNV